MNFIEGVYSVSCGSSLLRDKAQLFKTQRNLMNLVLLFGGQQNLNEFC